ncbi:MAG: ATP-binding protein, partial [Candidatus Omnitrophica bacterium]|nr:ATP-binding protein [Candidatus Omnitrophota bacterium]
CKSGMEEKILDVLLVEDSAFDAKLIRDLFQAPALRRFRLEQSKDLADAFTVLEKKPFDIILLDLTLPDCMGLETFMRMYGRRPSIPVVLLTRIDDERLAVEALELGAQDYLIKGQVDAMALQRSIRYAIERKRWLEELRSHAESLEQQVMARTNELIETIKRLKSEIDKRTRAESELQKAFDRLKETQAQLIQAEKMETVGRLASGIAHEVKNPLAILLQGIEYLSKKIGPTDENTASVMLDMAEAVNRADAIIKGLLDFSSVSQIEKRPLGIEGVIDKALLLVKHQFDKYHIEVIKTVPAGLPPVTVDRNKLEQVFINLFENAVHAMEAGGRLAVAARVERVTLPCDGAGKRREDCFKPGDEVVEITVEDSGTGIPEQFVSKVFDPFFTTKRSRGGTGLGLSIVRNIIETHKGTIRIANKDGTEGTGVRVTIVLKAEPEGDRG